MDLHALIGLAADILDGAAVLVVLTGAAIALLGATAGTVRKSPGALRSARLALGRSLSLALELQLAGDVVRTAVSPTLHALGVLAAVAAIRTALNIVLDRDIRSEEAAGGS
ncbi:MAG: hypothetical protein JWN31_419 [Frankiales bacterium]|nr:hypothetical protein [Frankiales bacterium]